MIVLAVNGDSELLQKYYELRKAVFIFEQNVDPAIELDEKDGESDALHFAAVDCNGLVVGAGRLVTKSRELKIARLGRVCVRKERRGSGVAMAVVEKIIESARERGFEILELHSQLYTVSLYEKFGFVKKGEIFKEANIDHIEMFLKLK